MKQLLADAVSNRINWRNGLEPGPINRGTIENLILALERSQDYKLKGLTTDGVTFTYPKHFLEESIKDTLKEFGVTFHDWKSGNSWESIPLPVAMTLLAEAINTIRDPKTLFLIDFFAYMRSKDSLSHRALITRGAYERNRLGRAARTTQENYERVLQLKNIVLHHYPDSEGKFPFNSQGELVEHCQNVFDQCIVIFLCLTGIRISELASISGDDYNLETDGSWTFKSDLIKTAFGTTETRELSGLSAEAANVLTSLSFIDKRDRLDGMRIPLFSRYYYFLDYNKNTNPRATFRTESAQALRGRLNRVYDKFLINHPEFKEICASIHPHRFRHTWAEFAIRRFDGNVLEGIRAHFRHAYGSRFIKHYVFEKLSEEVKDKIEQKYLQEILTKLALENVESISNPSFQHDLKGKLVGYISQAMGTEVLSIEEVDDFVSEIMCDFERIVVHEYGICIVKKDTISQSKCLDVKTQTPKLERACFDLCSGCLHLLCSQSSNKESITRIAVSHSKMIKDFESVFGPDVKSDVIDASKKSLKNAESILASMEE